MTSELWIGVFIGGGIAMTIFFLMLLMWAIVARSSQISREEEALTLLKETMEETTNEIGKAFIPTMNNLIDDVQETLDHQKKYGVVNPDWKYKVEERPEPIPPDHDVKSS